MSDTFTQEMAEIAIQVATGTYQKTILAKYDNDLIVYENMLKAAHLLKRLFTIGIYPLFTERALGESLWQAHGPRMALALLDLWRIRNAHD